MLKQYTKHRKFLFSRRESFVEPDVSTMWEGPSGSRTEWNGKAPRMGRDTAQLSHGSVVCRARTCASCRSGGPVPQPANQRHMAATQTASGGLCMTSTLTFSSRVTVCPGTGDIQFRSPTCFCTHRCVSGKCGAGRGTEVLGVTSCTLGSAVSGVSGVTAGPSGPNKGKVLPVATREGLSILYSIPAYHAL